VAVGRSNQIRRGRPLLDSRVGRGTDENGEVMQCLEVAIGEDAGGAGEDLQYAAGFTVLSVAEDGDDGNRTDSEIARGHGIDATVGSGVLAEKGSSRIQALPGDAGGGVDDRANPRCAVTRPGSADGSLLFPKGDGRATGTGQDPCQFGCARGKDLKIKTIGRQIQAGVG
jgi:hypothetical protein